MKESICRYIRDAADAEREYLQEAHANASSNDTGNTTGTAETGGARTSTEAKSGR